MNKQKDEPKAQMAIITIDMKNKEKQKTKSE